MPFVNLLINQLALLFFLNMKNFAFRTRLSYLSIRKTCFLCYAVVNLLLFPHSSEWVARLSSSRSLSGGGLKWTRTIDLTLIRRVL